jgi:halocyanin-like protein
MSDDTADVSRRGFLRVAAGTTAAGAATGVAAGQTTNTTTTTTGTGTTTGAPTGTTTTADGEATTAPGTTTADGETTAAGTTTGGGGGSLGSGTPDLGGYLDDVGNYDGNIETFPNQSTVTVQVGTEGNGGNFAFSPPAIHVANGTTVQFEWTGEGGGHNVVAESEAFNSGSTVAEAGVNFEHTFSEDGVYQYYCNPHKASGMKGVVVVGTDYPTVDTGGGGGGSAGPAVPSSAKSLGVAATVAMVSTLGLAYFFLKYGGDYGASE